MHIHPFQAVYPKLEYITSTDSFFESVREDYLEFLSGDLFSKAEREALFVYQIRMEKRAFTGIIACVDIRDYLNGHIRKHEHTLPEKEQKQVQLLLRRGATVKPVLLAHPEAPGLTNWTWRFIENRTPFLRIAFQADRQEHLLWEVDRPEDIEKVQALFDQEVVNTYIADGHHRTTSTALLYERTNDEALRRRYAYLLCALFPIDELRIHDFNRVVEVPGDLSLTRFMAGIAQLFDIEILSEPVRPRRKHEILLFIDHEWYRLHWKEAVLQQYRHEEILLDTYLLNQLVLQDLLRIEDVRTDPRVEYVEGSQGIEGVGQKAGCKERCVGFCLYPVQADELMALADRKRMLPPKSTWFEPRMKNGLIVYEP